MLFLRLLLFPFYPVIFIVILLRNKLYDYKIISSYIPTIKCVSIGNLKVGGTGKTPFTNMLIAELKKSHKIALLSRGYGRKSSGYVFALPNSTSKDIGDESKMMTLYHPDISVAVCESRELGITSLSVDVSGLDMILLDDAMQHRSIAPQVNIMLTEYSNPYYKDSLFPVGLLRDIRRSAKRADIVIVTKSPDQLSVEQMDKYVKRIRHKEKQKIFFSTVDSLLPVPISNIDAEPLALGSDVVILSAIASPTKFINNISKKYNVIKTFKFKDHHNFSEKEVNRVVDFADEIGAKVVMTPKDSVKIDEMTSLQASKRDIMFVQDISFRILEYRGGNLNTLIKELIT